MKTHFFNLTQKDIEEFKVLYEKYCGEIPEDEHASMVANQLIAFMSYILYE
ncbi:MAG: hypothetical protein Crog4KO_18890 [Crocinitomicaceae bacterium]